MLSTGTYRDFINNRSTHAAHTHSLKYAYTYVREYCAAVHSGAVAERSNNESKLWANAFHVNLIAMSIHFGVVKRKQKITATNCAINTITIETGIKWEHTKQNSKGAPINMRKTNEAAKEFHMKR